MISSNSRLVFAVIITLFTLTGCFNQKTPSEKIYDVLEKVVLTEEKFEEQQDPLVLLEKQEKALYDKIVVLGMKDHAEVLRLSNEALQMIEKRKSHLVKEQESIEASKKEFLKVKKLLEKLKDPELTKRAKLLQTTMMQRYDIHETLFINYMQSLKYDQELYEMFKKPDLTLDQLEDQVIKLNESYRAVFKANESFNELTKKYNNEKLAFYNKTDLWLEERK